MSIPSMRVHTDPPPQLEGYECPYLGCSYTEWAFVPSTCPNHRSRLVLRPATRGGAA